MEYTNQTANISAYTDIFEDLTDVPIVNAATAYYYPNTGTTTILVIGQALFIGDKVSNTLFCPNQLRSNGVIVNDVPLYLTPDIILQCMLYTSPIRMSRYPYNFMVLYHISTVRHPEDKS